MLVKLLRIRSLHEFRTLAPQAWGLSPRRVQVWKRVYICIYTLPLWSWVPQNHPWYGLEDLLRLCVWPKLRYRC